MTVFPVCLPPLPARAGWLVALLAGAAAAQPPAAPAQPSGALPVYDVYVTGESDVVEQVTTVREVGDQDMQDESARNLDEALRRQPSLVVRRGGEGVARLDLRGLRTRQILLLVDGVPVRSTEDGNFDPSLIPSQIIDRVDVTYGNSSVLYGEGPLAGVLQVRTRLPEAGVQAHARGDFREGNQFLGQGSVGGSAQGFKAYAAGSYRSAEGYPLPRDFDATSLENGGLRDNSDRDQGNAFLKLGYAPSESGRVDLLFDYRDAESGVPWVVYDSSEDPLDLAPNPRFERVNDLSGFFSQLSGQVDLSEHFGLRSWGYVDRQVEVHERYDDASFSSMTRNNTFDLKGTALTTGGALHARYDLGSFGVLRFAGNGRYESFVSRGHVTGTVGGGRGGGAATVSRPLDEANSLGVWSLGLEYELRPVEELGVVLGYAHAFQEGSHVAEDGSLFLGGAYYDLPTDTRLRASAAHRLRFPSIRQLYDPDGGNPDLQSERCWCFEAGISQRLPRETTVAVTGFWMELSDFIERLESGGPFENREQLRNRGVEVEVTSQPWSWLFLRLAWSYLDARDVSNNSPEDRLANRPRHKLDAVARYTFPWKTRFRLAFTYAADTLEYSRSNPALNVHLDDFVLLDLRLEQPLWDDRVLLYAGVDNVLDQEWTYNFGFPQAGRTVFGGVELAF